MIVFTFSNASIKVLGSDSSYGIVPLILEINSKFPEAFSITIKNILSFEDYKKVLRELDKIIIFSDIKIHSLSSNELNLRTLFIGDFNQIQKLFNNFSSFSLETVNKKSVTLIYN